MFKKVYFFILLILAPIFLTGCTLINVEKNTKEVAQKDISNKSEKSIVPLFLNAWFNELEQPIDQRVALQHKAIPRHPQFPPSPTNINVIDPNIGTILNISWSNPKEIVFDNIRVYRSEEKNKLGKLVVALDGRVSFFQDKELERNKNYYYTVRSVVSRADFNNSNVIKEQESNNIDQKMGRPVDKVPPFPPKDIQIISGQKSGNLSIKWTNPIDDDFDHVQIYRSEVINKIGMLIRADVKSSSFDDDDDDLKDNKSYYYILTAVDKSGNESLINLIDVGKIEPFEIFKEEKGGIE